MVLCKDAELGSEALDSSWGSTSNLLWNLGQVTTQLRASISLSYKWEAEEKDPVGIL